MERGGAVFRILLINYANSDCNFSEWEFDLRQASMIRYVQDVSDALRCASCKNVFRKRVLQASCGDRVCTECFESLFK